MYWKNPRTVRRRTVRHRRVFDSDGMDIKKTPRTDARHASIVRQGLEWALTYGQRSAAVFLLVRKVPRPVVERIPISMDGRGRALVVVRQSRRRWEDAYCCSLVRPLSVSSTAYSPSACLTQRMDSVQLVALFMVCSVVTDFHSSLGNVGSSLSIINFPLIGNWAANTVQGPNLGIK